MIHSLATTRDPELLVPGSLEALHTDADELDATADMMRQAAHEVSRHTIAGWLGGAAAGWADRRAIIDQSLSAVAEVFAVAAGALRSHAEVLAWARGEAGAAVDLWAQEQDILVCSAGTLVGVGVGVGGVGLAGSSLSPQPAFGRDEDDEASSEAHRILAHAVDRVRLSARSTAEVLDLLSTGLPDGRWRYDQWFAALGEWAVAMLPVVRVVRTAVDYDRVSAEHEARGEAIRAAVKAIGGNPDQTVPILFDTQTLEDNPGGWWGAAAPGLVLSAAGGAGAASRALASIKAPKTLRTFTSADPLVGDIANHLERARPGWIVGVNHRVLQTNGLKREVDVEVGTVLVQVKSGDASRLTGQLQRTELMTGRTAIGYAPTIKHGAWADALRKGVAIARTPEELVALLREFQ